MRKSTASRSSKSAVVASVIAGWSEARVSSGKFGKLIAAAGGVKRFSLKREIRSSKVKETEEEKKGNLCRAPRVFQIWFSVMIYKNRYEMCDELVLWNDLAWSVEWGLRGIGCWMEYNDWCESKCGGENEACDIRGTHGEVGGFDVIWRFSCSGFLLSLCSDCAFLFKKSVGDELKILYLVSIRHLKGISLTFFLFSNRLPNPHPSSTSVTSRLFFSQS